MKLVFLKTPLFTRLRGNYLIDQHYRELRRALMENPEMGDVMPSTVGFRKVRWEDARRGKGKRGGLRVIYYYLTAAQPTTRSGSSPSMTRVRPLTGSNRTAKTQKLLDRGGLYLEVSPNGSL